MMPQMMMPGMTVASVQQPQSSPTKAKKDKARKILSNKKNQTNDHSAKNIVKEILRDA